MKGEILSIETTQYIQELKNTIESQSDIIQELQQRIDKTNWWLKEMLKQANYDETKAIINGALELLLEGKDE